MKLRLYWLGPATEPGTWGLDTGVGTPIWRVFGGWELIGLVTSEEIPPNAPADTPRPRGWINVYPENGFRFKAPQGDYQRLGICEDERDPILQGYFRYAIKPF
jgi:hypothetical protein